MIRIRAFLLGAIFGAGGMFWAHWYHIVRTSDGVLVVRRAERIQLRSTYTDVRGWDRPRWEQYPELTTALEAEGYGDLMQATSQDAAADGPGWFTGTPEAVSASPSGIPANPKIVFGEAVGERAIGSSGRSSGVTQSPAAEDSLLGRLSRQLQQSPGVGQVPGTDQNLRERPLSREITSPFGQPGSAAIQNANTPQMPGGENRAAVPDRPLPGELLPSIHAAGLERMTNEVESTARELTQGLPPATRTRLEDELTSAIRGEVGRYTQPRPAAPPQTPPVSRSPAGNVNSPPASPPAQSRPATPNPRSWRADPPPADIDATRLRDRLPSSVQEGWKILSPRDDWVPSTGAGPAPL